MQYSTPRQYCNRCALESIARASSKRARAERRLLETNIDLSSDSRRYIFNFFTCSCLRPRRSFNDWIGYFSSDIAHLDVIFSADNIALGDREYYDPIALCTDALHSSKPIVFASINYRLGALGFLHCPEAAEYLPSNNGYVIDTTRRIWLCLTIGCCH